MAKKLTKTELLEMEKNLAEQRAEEREEQILLLMKSNELLKLDKMQLESQIRIKDINASINNAKNSLSIKKKISRDFNNKMKTKYKLKNGWGINPDTGLILEEE